MKTVQLDRETAKQTVEDLVSAARTEAVRIHDPEGKVAFLVVPTDNHEDLAYAMGYLDMIRHKDEILEAQSRKGGITTKELLEKCEKAARDAEVIGTSEAP